MKSILIIVAFAIVGLIISAPPADLVTGITPPTGYVGNVALTFTVATSGWTDGDKIILTTGNAPGNDDPSHTVSTVPQTNTITATLNFKAPGDYKVFVERGTDAIAQVAGQDSIKIVIEVAPVPVADLVTEISPTTGTVGDVALSITVKTSDWASDDKIILSTGTPPDANDLSYTVDPAQPTSPISVTLTFPAVGTYKVWVQRSAGKKAQEGPNSTPISIDILPPGDLVTAISPTTGTIGDVELQISVKTSDWVAGDEIILTTLSAPGANDLSHPVATVPTSSPLSVILAFPAVGTYKVWVKRVNSQTAQVAGPNSTPISIDILPVPTADLVTAISPTTGYVGNVALEISVKIADLEAGDKIILTTLSAPGTNDPSHTVSTVPQTSPISATINFPAADTYNVWVKRANSQIAQVEGQPSSPISIEISPAPVDKPDADLISEITATNPKAEVETEFTFKLKTNVSLKQNDKIYLSTEATTPTSTDKSVTVDTAPTEATFSGKFTLAKAGAYSAFVTRGSETTKQTAPAITVASSGYITMTLAIVLGLFLF